MKSFIIKFKKQLVMALVILGVVGLDQLSKILVLKNVENIEENGPFTIIKGIINLSYLENEGAAFGMLADHRWVFMTLSTVAIIGMGVYLFAFSKEGWFFQLGFALIIGGGIGNMIDRTVYGFVVDMIEVDFMEFAIFNVADSFVCIGTGIVILMLILEIIKDPKKEQAEKAEKEEINDGN